MIAESSSEKKLSCKNISFKLEQISSHLLKATIKIAEDVSSSLRNLTVKLYQKNTDLQGFKKNETPLVYIKDNYKEEIELILKNLLFKHIVLDYLMDQIIIKKIHLANYPRLNTVSTNKNKEILFVFDLSVADKIELKEWKNFIFRPPKRKKYKDLDKQVSAFLKREVSNYKQQQNFVQENDWINFQATIIDKDEKPVFNATTKSYWILVNNKFLSKPFQSELLNKKIGESFITNSLPIKNAFHNDTDHNKYNFLIKIKHITKGNYFSIDNFKSNFKLKSKQEIHRKLIEIFSYRDDISQRKSIIEELFHLLLSKHRFEVPKHFVIRRQEDILKTLCKHPDYQVYKQQEDFLNQVETLAEKQLKEEIIVDQISYNENLKVDEKDIQNYLSLFNNNKLKEFIHFKPLLEKIEDNDAPLQTGLLKQAVLREKTLNYIIHTLTK